MIRRYQILISVTPLSEDGSPAGQTLTADSTRCALPGDTDAVLDIAARGIKGALRMAVDRARQGAPFAVAELN